MNKRILLASSIFGILAVGFGAFGAHALKDHIGLPEFELWSKGVEYQFYHTFALLFLSLSQNEKIKFRDLSAILFSTGICLFSGSLYLLAIRDLLSVEITSYIGPVTPVGGLLLILGWVSLFFSALNKKNA